MSQPTIRGWFTDIPSWPGRDGIHTPESGLAVPTFHSESASESAGSAAGAGIIGDSIGTTTSFSITTRHTTPTAELFITAAITTMAQSRTAMFTTVPAQPPGLSTAIARQLEDTLNRAVRAVSAPALTAAMTMADRCGVTRPAEAPVWAVVALAEVEDLTAAAGIIDRREKDRPA